MAKKKIKKIIKKRKIVAVEPDEESEPNLEQPPAEVETPEKEEETDPETDEEILELARSRFRMAEEDSREVRAAALDDLEFRAGKQWPDDIIRARKDDNRPCMTVNKMPQHVRQITNEQRQNRPQIKISPVDDHADKDTAKVLQGLIRSIGNNSNADIAIDSAFEGAVESSFGFFRIATDYINPMSFDQEILIKQVPNRFSVYLDPSSKEPDGSDANWGFVFEDVSKDEFRAQYPDSKALDMSEWTSTGDDADWLTEASCRVAEYFYKTFKKQEIVQFSNGVVLLRKDVAKAEIPEGVTEVNSRVALVPVIKWCKINGVEVMEKKPYKGKWIPLVPVYGSILDINGKKVIESVIRHAKDSQRAFNYFVSAETEAIALAPKAPFIAAEGQITPEYRPMWESANVKNHSHLVYKPVSLLGQLAPPPQRNAYEAPIQAITSARMQSTADIKDTTGIQDASLGIRSNEQSGIAIQRRNMQS
jgi:hypothetical protein